MQLHPITHQAHQIGVSSLSGTLIRLNFDKRKALTCPARGWTLLTNETSLNTPNIAEKGNFKAVQ